MSSHWLTVGQQQRVDVLGDLSPKTTDVWVAMHGYGQLVEYFKRHFRELATAERAFVLPQGAHKFYLEGTEGRVGASWMTKDAREKDILNQRLYLGAVLDWVVQRAPNARLHIVGFSQGVATAMRFIGYSHHEFSSLLAWAGSWPPDLQERNITALAALKMSAWFGTTDPFVQEAKKQERIDFYAQQYDLHPEIGTYDGAHTFDAAILKAEIERLEFETT